MSSYLQMMSLLGAVLGPPAEAWWIAAYPFSRLVSFSGWWSLVRPKLGVSLQISSEPVELLWLYRKECCGAEEGTELIELSSREMEEKRIITCGATENFCAKVHPMRERTSLEGGENSILTETKHLQLFLRNSIWAFCFVLFLNHCCSRTATIPLSHLNECGMRCPPDSLFTSLISNKIWVLSGHVVLKGLHLSEWKGHTFLLSPLWLVGLEI